MFTNSGKFIPLLGCLAMLFFAAVPPAPKVQAQPRPDGASAASPRNNSSNANSPERRSTIMTSR